MTSATTRAPVCGRAGFDDGVCSWSSNRLLNRRSSSATRAASAYNCDAWVSIWIACPTITSRTQAFVARNCATSTVSAADDSSDTHP